MPTRILILKPSALGDVATTLPLLCDLHAALPEAEIDWLIHPANLPVIQGHDALHAPLLFDRKNLAAWWYKPASTRRFSGLLRQLRDRQYDIVIDAQGLFRSGFLTRITGAKTRVGFAHAREGAALAYTRKVTLPLGGKRMRAVDRMRALGTPLGTDIARPAAFRVPLQTDAVSAAAKLLPDPQPFIAVIPGARWDTKRWPVERYAQVVRELLAAGRQVVLLGSPDEKPLCDEIQSKIKTQKSEFSAAPLNLAGQTDIATMIALLARARLLLGNDSGPLHLAAALGTPVVGLYGPTSPEFVGPFGQLPNVLRHDVPCHPCRRRTCDHHSCMQGLTVEVVWEKTRELI